MQRDSDSEYIDNLFRIEELKSEVEELTDGVMMTWESADCPPDIAVQFWEHIVAFERAAEVTYDELLRRDGVELPAIDTLDDDALCDMLWRIIYALARRNIFLHSTDHLSDRSLYARLRNEVLNETTRDLPPASGMLCGLDLVGSGSEEDIEIWLTYYADEAERAHWLEQFPDTTLPPHIDPPYDRDRHLPQAVFPDSEDSAEE